MWLDWFEEAGISGLADIILMSLILYTLLVWFKTRRAGFVLRGIIIIAAFYIMSRQFSLSMTSAVFEQFFTVILIALVVIFQEDLRYFFEQVALWSTNRRIGRRPQKKTAVTRKEVDILVRTLGDLAKEKIGVLIVLRGKEMILRHLDGGVDLNGELSEPLLKSLFDPHSIGHDGAVLMEGNRVVQFGCHLPLSKNLKKIGKGGTRHTAALGLAELSDALCLVVSEERGTISIARHGDLNVVEDLEQLARRLERFYDEINPQTEQGSWKDFYKKNSREKLFAIVLSVLLWFVLVEGSKVTYQTFSVPIEYSKLPKPWYLESLSPKNVEVTFRGPTRGFYFLRRHQVKLFVDMKLEEGLQTIKIFPYDLTFPKNMVLEHIEPREALALIYQEKPKEKKISEPSPEKKPETVVEAAS